MKQDDQIERELRDFPVPYTVEKRKSHYFLYVEGHPRMCIGGNSSKTSRFTVRATVSKLRQIRAAALSPIDEDKEDA